MTFDEFEQSLGAAAPPAALSPPLRALWLDGKGDWAGAHGVAQDVESAQGAAIHAYLHRKEGDAENAGYWYRRAGRAVERGALDHEWARLVREGLGSSGSDR